MSNIKARVVSPKYAKKFFSITGIAMIIYTMFVLLLPFGLYEVFELTGSPIMKDDFLFFGIYLLIVVFGTLIPFMILRVYGKVKFRHIARNASATFLELFVQTIVLFTACIILTYISNIVLARFGLDGKLICSIGLTFNNEYLGSILYVFMLLIVTPILEEYAFRGVLLNVLGRYGKGFALIVSSSMFALAHCNISEFLPALAMGYILGKISIRYKSIQPTILIHILFNVFLYVLCILPQNITKYMAIVLVAIAVLAGYLILSGRYQFIRVAKSKNVSRTSSLFCSRASVIIAIILMLASTALFTFLIP